jgi:hypothetical protein
MTIVTPLFLSYLIKYFNDEQNMSSAITYGLLMTLAFFVNIITQNYQAFKGATCGMQMRLGLNALIYEKVRVKHKFQIET